MKAIKGSGIVKTENRNVDFFDSIEITGAGTFKIVSQSNQSITLSAEDNLLPLIKTEVENKKLKIFNEESIKPKKSIIFNINVENLESLYIAGAGDFKIIDIVNRKFELNVDGAGNIDISGETDFFKVTINGAGNLIAKDLIAKDVVISVSGAGRANVFASETLNAELDGIGYIGYYGDPENVDKEVSGFGFISKKNAD